MSDPKKLAEQLGVSYGAAISKLRKLVLFDLLKRHDKNICYRCDKPIETADELSMDHKEPWLGNDTALYWDIENNIAFSHLSCNSGAARRSQKSNPQHGTRLSRYKRMAEQLGMSHGTAAHRLRKMIIFDLLKRYGENICYRCGKSIEIIDKLSVDHKEPWRGKDTALFWNIDNIAWAHLFCNISAGDHSAGGKRMVELYGSIGTPESRRRGGERSQKLYGSPYTVDGSAKGGRTAMHNRWHVKAGKPCNCTEL